MFDTIDDLENAFSNYTQNFIKQALDEFSVTSEVGATYEAYQLLERVSMLAHRNQGYEDINLANVILEGKEPHYHLDNNDVEQAISEWLKKENMDIDHFKRILTEAKDVYDEQNFIDAIVLDMIDYAHVPSTDLAEPRRGSYRHHTPLDTLCAHNGYSSFADLPDHIKERINNILKDPEEVKRVAQNTSRPFNFQLADSYNPELTADDYQTHQLFQRAWHNIMSACHDEGHTGMISDLAYYYKKPSKEHLSNAIPKDLLKGDRLKCYAKKLGKDSVFDLEFGDFFHTTSGVLLSPHKFPKIESYFRKQLKKDLLKAKPERKSELQEAFKASGRRRKEAIKAERAAAKKPQKRSL